MGDHQFSWSFWKETRVGLEARLPKDLPDLKLSRCRLAPNRPLRVVETPYRFQFLSQNGSAGLASLAEIELSGIL